MAPTLQDVSFLLGLPLAGAVVGPTQAPGNWRDEMQARFAGLHQENPLLDNSVHGPRVSFLSKFQVRLLQLCRLFLTIYKLVLTEFLLYDQCR